MRQLVGFLAVVWAAANLYAGYLLTTSGFRLSSKGIEEQGMLVTGGVLIGLFALVLLVQSVRLFVSRG